MGSWDIKWLLNFLMVMKWALKRATAVGNLPYLLSFIAMFGVATILTFSRVYYLYHTRHWVPVTIPSMFNTTQESPQSLPVSLSPDIKQPQGLPVSVSPDIKQPQGLPVSVSPDIKQPQGLPVSVSPDTRQPQGQRSGYVMVFSYDEQLESAMYDIYQLANLVADWNMQLIEPFVYGTFFGIPKLSNRIAANPVLQFQDVYNVTAVNRQFSTCLKTDYPIFEKFETCVSQKFDRVILIKFTWKSTESCTNQLRAQCRRVEEDINQLAVSTLKKTTLSPGNIKVTNHACVDVTKAVNFRELPFSIPAWNEARRNVEQSHSNILVLILDWHGIRTKYMTFFYLDPQYKQKNCRDVHSISHSDSIIHAAQEYFKFLKLVKPVLGIHIRLERLLEDDKHNPGYMKECINKLTTVARILIEKYHLHYNNTIAFRDYGPLGSSTCRRWKCSLPAQQLHVDDQLKSLNIHTTEYDPNVFRRPNSRGFSSVVEKELLSRADYLLTVGKGSFQASITNRFLANHKHDGDQRLFTLCSTTYGERLPGLKL